MERNITTAVVIAPSAASGTVAPGTSVALDGRQSVAIPGATIPPSRNTPCPMARLAPDRW